MKFVPCRKCHKSKTPGYIPSQMDGYSVLVECSCHKIWKEQWELEIKIKSSGLSEDDLQFNENSYIGSQKEELIPKILRYVDKFDSVKSDALYFYGINGTQKTTVAKWIGIKLIQKGYKIQYVTMKALIDVLIASFQDSNEERIERKDLYDRYMNCDLLILDEVFDRSKVILYASGYQIPFLDQFIRSRLDMMKKGILFISNKTISQISSEGFGESLQDLIERKVILRNANLTFSDRVFDSISKNNFTGTFD